MRFCIPLLGIASSVWLFLVVKKSATFGPFDRQVLIMNTDGKTFTMLENPTAMRLKKAGFINDKRAFITQPSVEDLEKAENPEGGGFLGGLFGGN